MLFVFLKYLQPTHYFALYKKDKRSVFSIPDSLPNSILKQLQTDDNYSSVKANEYDMSWQAIQKGYIGSSQNYTKFERLPLKDEYRFIRKYFKPLWSVYILMIRLLSFKNPFREISAWRNSLKTKRNLFLKSPIIFDHWKDYNSSLIEKQIFVTVIIPTLNRYPYLKEVLTDLKKQDYSNFEVIVVDQSEPFQKEFYNEFNLDLHVIHQEEKALWLARNKAIQRSKGDFLLLFDDDSRIESNWIANHIKCLDFFNADISSGVSISKVGAKIPENYPFFRISDQLDTGNVLIKKEVFKKIGLFDRQFEGQRMGDGEFGLRAHLNGFLNISNPYAKRLHLKVGSGGLRQIGSWDGFRPNKLFDPRPIPSVIYFYRKYYGKNRTRLSLLKTIPPSIMPYRFKKNKNVLILGVFISVLLTPFILLQVYLSWRRASKKLTQGPLIGELK